MLDLMPLDLVLFATKLRGYRDQFQATVADVSAATGISAQALDILEAGGREPSGDEILILAEYFRCDYKFFISNAELAPFERTEKLFRRFGPEFSASDRWAIQEFLFLSENEEFLERELGKRAPRPFLFTKRGTHFKSHGRNAAAQLRMHLGHKANEVPIDVFDDFRSIGVHVFRRELANSNISGLFIKHPTAGRCVLVNYLDDVYRQRFTAAHEGGHSILDVDEDFVVSFGKWDRNDLVEIRANTFAADYLLPPEFLKRLPRRQWLEADVLDHAQRFKLNVEPLLIALERHGLMDAATAASLKGLKVPRHLKRDPELPDSLTDRQRERKASLLKRGLSAYYVNLCFDAYERGIVSAARMAEMMLCDEKEIVELGDLYGWRPSHA